MSITWNQRGTEDSSNNRLLDRLVDGALPDAERRKLLLQLESEPDGWRRCALAFLEAQSWREAFAPLAAPVKPAAVAAVPSQPMAKPWRTVVRAASLAACVVAAFAFGWASKPTGSSESPKEFATIRPGSDVNPLETHARANVEPDSEPADAALESVVKAWERRGYSAERQQALVTVKLRDGSELEVPAQEIKLRYTGDRTY